MTETADQTPSTAVLIGSHEPAPVPAVAGPHAVAEAGHHGTSGTSGHDGGGHDDGAHPTDAKYIKIAGILAAITAFEVGIYYVKGGLGDGFAPLLIGLAAIKFFVVGAYFMHLRFDNRVLRRFFLTGIILACIIYALLFLLLGVFSETHGAHV
jgi:cytochrome c oxidase subunit 4